MRKELFMAKLSEIVYKRDSRMREELEKLGIKSFIKREIKDLKYIIIEKNDELYMAIRGSANKKNWMRNFNFFPKKGVHRGFKKASDVILKDIKLLKLEDKLINVTGHSLAGAISMLVGLELKANSIYTFGQPRVFTRKKKINLDGILYKRYINNLDVVTQVPPVWLGYKHHTIPYYITHNGVIYIDPSDKVITVDRLETLAKNKNIKETYKDHEISYYIKLIEDGIK